MESSSTGSTSRARGWASRPSKSLLTNGMCAQSVWHCGLPGQLKSLARGRLGEQPDCCDGRQLDHWPDQAGEKPHQVGQVTFFPFLNTFLSSPDRVPYPFRLAASADTLAVISMVCCETWQVPESHLEIKVFQGSLAWSLSQNVTLKESFSRLPCSLFVSTLSTMANFNEQWSNWRTEERWVDKCLNKKDLYQFKLFSWRLLRRWQWMSMGVFSWSKAMEDSTRPWFSGPRSKLKAVHVVNQFWNC